MYYIAYGSNLNRQIMKARCPESKLVGTARFIGYNLAFKGSKDGFGYLTVEDSENGYFDAGIYKITHKDAKLLDRCEGYPTLYHKEYLDVEINGNIHSALIYVMNPEFDYHLPSRQYFISVYNGFESFNFDTENLNLAYGYTLDNMQDNIRRK